MAEIPWEAVVGVLVPLLSGLLWIEFRTDKRLDQLESENKLIQFRLNQLAEESARADRKTYQAVTQISGFLENHGFRARGESELGPWPGDDPPSAIRAYRPTESDDSD